MTDRAPASALAGLSAPFRAVAGTVVPEAQALDATQWAEMERIITTALADRPVGLVRQLRLLVRALEWLPLLRYGRRLSSLDLARRTAFLSAVQDAPLLLLRRGFWGLRTLILMGYYGRAAASAEIGYRATPAGWEARR